MSLWQKLNFFTERNSYDTNYGEKNFKKDKHSTKDNKYKGDNPPQCLGSILFWCKSGSWIRPEKMGTDYGSIIFFSAVWIWFWEQNVVLLVFLRPFYTLGSGSGNPTIYGLTNSYRHISEWQTATGQFPERRIPEIRTRKIKFRSENFRVQWKIKHSANYFQCILLM